MRSAGPRTTSRRAGAGAGAGARSPAKARGGSTIDPRIRDRRAEVLRTQARRRLRAALAVVVLVALVGGAWAILHSRIFSARVVSVVGSVHTPVAAILRAGGLDGGPPLIDVGAATVHGIEQLPWVARATVDTQWPDGVRVVVVERTPVAAVEEAPPSRGWAVVDRTGKVLQVQAQAPAGLVHVIGAEPPGPPGSVDGPARSALLVAASLPKAFASLVASVQADGSGDVTLHLTSPLTVYLGSTADLHQKYEDVAAILAGASLTSGQLIDVAAPASPIVKG